MDSKIPSGRFLCSLFVLMVLALTFGCSDGGGYTTYSHNGFSVEYPKSWRFERDQSFSFNGSREVVFEFGAVSYAAFYYNDSLKFEQFSQAYLEDSHLKDAEKTAKILSKRLYDVASRPALDYQITAQFMGPINTQVIVVDVSADAESVYLVVAIDEDDQIDINPLLSHVVSSVKVSE